MCRDSCSAVILAGGKGTRMGQLTQDIPKPLLQVQGRPIIDYAVAALLDGGIDDVQVVVGHLKGKWYDKKLYQNEHGVSLIDGSSWPNMVSAFLHAVQTSKHEDIIGLSGDVVFEKSVVPWATSTHSLSDGPVNVFLQRCETQQYKRWKWVTAGERLIDIQVSSSSTGFEKYCVTCQKALIHEYTRGFTDNMGTSDREFIQHSEYKRGWVYLLKRLCEAGYPIGAYFGNKHLHNLNAPADLEAVDEYLRLSKK